MLFLEYCKITPSRVLMHIWIYILGVPKVLHSCMLKFQKHLGLIVEVWCLSIL